LTIFSGFFCELANPGAKWRECDSQGPTREAALESLRRQFEDRLREGTEIVALEVAPPIPWVEFAGMFQGNSMFDEVQRIMAENRQRDEADPDYP
jgi:hypothetical protein